MRTNAWIALELSIAQAWWAYYQWVLGGQEGAEPALDNFGKNAIRRLVDLDFSFQCFKKATIGAQDFRMLSVFDVTEAQVNLGYIHSTAMRSRAAGMPLSGCGLGMLATRFACWTTPSTGGLPRC